MVSTKEVIAGREHVRKEGVVEEWMRKVEDVCCFGRRRTSEEGEVCVSGATLML